MHYVIIGNGVAGITAALTLRERDRHARITMISGESDYFFSRTALMYAYMDRMNLRDLEPFERKVYTARRIDRIRGWVSGLDARARTLSLAGGQSLTYDKLLIAAGSVPNRPAWPGLASATEGAVHFVSLQDLAECERLTPSTRRAVVAGGGLIGVELVECLVHHGVQVEFLIREPWYWPMSLGSDEGALIAEHIGRRGVRIRFEEEIAEVRCDSAGRVSGVRTSNGSEIECQLLGIAIGVRPAVDWLIQAATPPAVGRGIQVGPDFKTSLPEVWAAGDCAEFNVHGTPLVEQIWYSAKRHGLLAAQAMLGDTIRYEPPLFYNSAKFFELEYTTVGRVLNVPAGSTSFSHRLSGREASVRIVEHNGAVIGFNMLGSRWDHTVFERWIAERRSLGEVMASLQQAQFDVEFGRLPLDEVRAAYAAGSFRSTAA